MSALSRRGFVMGMAALATPGLAQTRPPHKPQQSADRLIDAAGLGEVAYALVDAATGEVLAARDAGRPMAPASTLKAVTALYALDRLGAGTRLATRVLVDGDRMILAGGGDPTLSTDDLATLAGVVAASGAVPPARFEIWGGALPAIPEISPGQQPQLPYNPSLSGMMLNFNRVHLGWRQGQGGPALTLEARAGANRPRAYTIAARTKAGGAPLFDYVQAPGREEWAIAPAALRGTGSRWLPVRQPELYAGDVFQTLCRAKGLVLPKPEIATEPPRGTEIARLDSPPLREIMRGMMDYSTNLTAEALGLLASGAGDLAASGSAMQGWARGRGVSGDFRFLDHSGMSPDSRVTAAMMAGLMAGYGRSRGLRGVMKTIPRRDGDGKRIPDGARGPIEAKTGTLNFVSNLTGYLRPPGRRELCFAIYVADPDRRAGTEGQELPAGVIGWTTRAKRLQQQVIDLWVDGYA